MQLKTKVFVLEINNLSDARYCASMGVDTIGFTTEGEKSISKEEMLAIIQWVSGVKIGIEINVEDQSMYQFIEENGIEVIISSNKEILNHFSNKTTIAKGFTSDQSTYSYLNKHIDQKNLIVDAPAVKDILTTLSNSKVNGLVLKGGEEERPGYKTFDELADILEALEL